MAYCGPKGIPLDEFLSWSQHSQDAALHWQAQEARRCPGCSTLPEEWEPDLGGSGNAYIAERVICPGCARLNTVREDQPPPGRHYRLVPPTGDEHDDDQEV